MLTNPQDSMVYYASSVPFTQMEIPPHLLSLKQLPNGNIQATLPLGSLILRPYQAQSCGELPRQLHLTTPLLHQLVWKKDRAVHIRGDRCRLHSEISFLVRISPMLTKSSILPESALKHQTGWRGVKHYLHRLDYTCHSVGQTCIQIFFTM